MFQTVVDIFNTFGSTVIIPIVLFIVGKCLGVDTKKALMSGILCGAGLAGFSLLIGSYTGIISPIVDQMVNNTSVNLPVLDIGWQSAAIVGYATKIGIAFFAIEIIIQLVLFFTRWTNVFMPTNIWENYQPMLWGSMLYLITKDIWLAMGLMVVQSLYIILGAELLAKRYSTYYKYPQCVAVGAHDVEPLPFAILMNWLMNKLGLYKVKLNAQKLQDRFGMFGEPMFIGLFIGALIALIANYNKLNTLEAWGTITSAAITTAAVMAVFPRVAALFASAFSTLALASRDKVKNQDGSAREWYLAIDDAVGYGEANTLTTGIVLIPIMLLIAFILPGNQTLPMVDLIAIPYMIQTFVCINNGNILKSLISGGIWMTIGLYVCTAVAPYFTEVAMSTGIDMTAGVMVISFCIMARPLMALMFLAFVMDSPIGIIAVVVSYFICFFIVKKFKPRIVAFMEKQAMMEELE